jgi:hypothetical protein
MYLWAMKQNPLFICAFVLVSTSLALDVSARVMQDIDEPFAYTETPPKSVSNPKPHVVQKRANGKVQAAYFSNWCVLCFFESLHSGLATDRRGIYGADFRARPLLFSDNRHGGLTRLPRRTD